ncbi:helix-turn-helix domain-containing protein [Ectopseudomonas alcaliphila]|uniref:Helix-turn-helix domain-containing protein n=1 Tax=Ectopseudomonas alcaliphila TaxID=101564 RepID=A0A1G6VIJ5_9GAMM|nr:helix-turn-helix transcriptional regulator [Pseudomonas alcaliphila]MDX5991790.1 helix-turn-helix transcriptional regulator [Pseudomonas alcaliphila]SDD52676.1 Helix-turn-helix domain-containing protein [Pseudomonas alcaliphila]
MSVQIIARDGQPEYAVLPWAEYQTLLQAAGRQPASAPKAVEQPVEAKRPALDQLRALREAKGLAAESLARSVGISPHYLAMIESGERQPDAAILRSLAWELGLEGWS